MISLSLADKNTYFLCLGEMNKLYIIKKHSHQIAK